MKDFNEYLFLFFDTLPSIILCGGGGNGGAGGGGIDSYVAIKMSGLYGKIICLYKLGQQVINVLKCPCKHKAIFINLSYRIKWTFWLINGHIAITQYLQKQGR